VRESDEVASGHDLRAAMRRYPAGVCVVGAAAEWSRIAVTIGSLVSLSLEPPLVGISVGLENALHELVRDAGAFGVSILRGEQEELARRFARGMPPIAAWEGVALRESVTGAPLVADALGWIEAHVAAEHRAGDHTFFVGEVVAAEQGEPGRGLVYRDGGYHAI
jgi:flavin reductase (DIM6/NTAB) family NADH-FMN oxidoreductase RutF